MKQPSLFFTSAYMRSHHTGTCTNTIKTSLASACLLITAACTPIIKVEAPSKPIEINLNVKIEHEIRIKVEKDLEELFEDESDIF